MDKNNVEAQRMLKTIEIDIYKPVPGRPGYVRKTGRVKVEKVFKFVEAQLKRLGLDIYEYMSLDRSIDKLKPVPDGETICYLHRGGSEGWLIRVDVLPRPERHGHLTRVPLFMIKHLGSADEAFQLHEAIARMLICEDYENQNYVFTCKQ